MITGLYGRFIETVKTKKKLQSISVRDTEEWRKVVQWNLSTTQREHRRWQHQTKMWCGNTLNLKYSHIGNEILLACLHVWQNISSNDREAFGPFFEEEERNILFLVEKSVTDWQVRSNRNITLCRLQVLMYSRTLLSYSSMSKHLFTWFKWSVLSWHWTSQEKVCI